jgi:hypothetical protein
MAFSPTEIDAFIHLQVCSLVDLFRKIEEEMFTNNRLYILKNVEMFMKEMEYKLEAEIDAPHACEHWQNYTETFLTSRIYSILSKNKYDNLNGRVSFLTAELTKEIKANPTEWMKYIKSAKFLLNNDGENDVNECQIENCRK